MAKGIVVYYSRSGNTREMAEMLAKAMTEAELPSVCKSVDQVNVEELTEYDAIAIGTPTYYGQMSAEVKQLFDELVSKHGKLQGKVGAAFSSSANIGGGNEIAIMGILQAMLVAGMVIQGDPLGDHYGPVSIGKPDERVGQQCVRRGRLIAELANKLASND